MIRLCQDLSIPGFTSGRMAISIISMTLPELLKGVYKLYIYSLVLGFLIAIFFTVKLSDVTAHRSVGLSCSQSQSTASQSTLYSVSHILPEKVGYDLKQSIAKEIHVDNRLNGKRSRNDDHETIDLCNDNPAEVPIDGYKKESTSPPCKKAVINSIRETHMNKTVIESIFDEPSASRKQHVNLDSGHEMSINPNSLEAHHNHKVPKIKDSRKESKFSDIASLLIDQVSRVIYLRINEFFVGKAISTLI
jgi:hypothetical protein